MTRFWLIAAHTSTLAAALNLILMEYFIVTGHWGQAGLNGLGFVGSLLGAFEWFRRAEQV